MPRTKQTAQKTTSLLGERVNISGGTVPPQSTPKPYARSTRSNGLKVTHSIWLKATEVTEELSSDELLVNAGEEGQQENNVSQ